MALHNSGITQKLDQLETTLDVFFNKKAPYQLPNEAKDLIVKIIPWLTLIFAVMAAPVLVVAFGLASILSPIAMMGGARAAAITTGGIIAGIPLLIGVVLELLAVKGLLAKQKIGWNYSFYSSLAFALSSILSYDIIGALFGALVSWYILFQIRSYYK